MPCHRLAVVLAALICTSAPAVAATFCVSNSSELQSALQTASTNADASDLIKLRAGTYVSPAGGFGRNQTFDGEESITIEGGWGSLIGNCDFSLNSSTASIIDGADINPGLIINRGNGTGSTTIRRLTITRGFQGGNQGNTNRGGGLAIFTVQGSDGGTTVENVIFRDNNASLIAGGAYLAGQPLVVRSNLFVGNGASTGSAISTISNSSTVYFNNNTVTQSVGSGPTSLVVRFDGDSAVYLSNNILWGNFGRDLFTDGQTIIANVIQSMAGTPALENGTIASDPLFVSPSDLRLRAGSPALNSGANTPFGGLSTRDLDGGVRVNGPAVDRGAYEADTFFANGFE